MNRQIWWSKKISRLGGREKKSGTLYCVGFSGILRVVCGFPGFYETGFFVKFDRWVRNEKVPENNNEEEKAYAYDNFSTKSDQWEAVLWFKVSCSLKIQQIPGGLPTDIQVKLWMELDPPVGKNSNPEM